MNLVQTVLYIKTPKYR